MAHPNVDLVRGAYESFSAGDMDGLRASWMPDVVWHAGGSHRLAGDYEGAEAIIGLFGEFMRASEGTMQVELQSVFADDETGFSLHKTTATKGGEDYELWTVLSYAFDNGKTKEVWAFEYDGSMTEKLLA